MYYLILSTWDVNSALSTERIPFPTFFVNGLHTKVLLYCKTVYMQVMITQDEKRKKAAAWTLRIFSIKQKFCVQVDSKGSEQLSEQNRIDKTVCSCFLWITCTWIPHTSIFLAYVNLFCTLLSLILYMCSSFKYIVAPFSLRSALFSCPYFPAGGANAPVQYGLERFNWYLCSKYRKRKKRPPNSESKTSRVDKCDYR